MQRASLLAALLCCACCATVVWAGTCTVDGANKHQVIDGFGFSSAWSGKLSPARNNALYNTLGMSILRVRIDEGGWFNDEIDNSNAAHANGAIVFGSSWTPPPNLRSRLAGTSDQYWLEPRNYAAFASFLNNAGNKLNLDYISFVNEPDINGGSRWTGAQLHDFVKAYGPALGKRVIFPEACNFQDQYSDPALNDPDAANKIAIIAGHIYGMGVYKHTNALSKGKHVWMTEYYVDHAVNDIGPCIEEAKSISDCMNNEFSAYVWWWVTDSDANIRLVDNSGTIYLAGHVMGQFAKFIRPGYVRVDTTFQPTANVKVTAYTGPKGELTIVAVNSGTSAVSQTFNLLNLGAVSSLRLFRSSASERMASVGTATVSGTTVTINLPGQSVTTAVTTTSGGGAAATCGATVAEGDVLSLGCPAGQVIGSIDFASYGTPSGNCSIGFTKSTCDANTTLSVLSSQCVGKQVCSVAGSNDVFGDPCSGLQKHLSASVTCIGSCGATVAEGDSLKLTCAAGQIISSVDFASYGTPTGDCVSGFSKSTCDSATSLAVVNAKCLGQSTCTVAGNNDAFGDPCSGTQKHLAVKATCLAPLAADVTCGTAGENANLVLGCAGGRKINKVTFASYGTPDGTCPDVKTNSACHASKSQAVVEAACLGKIACSVPATNDLFSDPCSGTIKKLTATITCA